MFARSRLIRAASSVPVAAVLAVFCLEWYSYNVILLPRVQPLGQGIARWLARTSSFNTAWLLALWSYLRCALTDPGRVPEEFRSQLSEFAGPYEAEVGLAEAKRGWQPARSTLCRKCQGRRPERAHHCGTCGACVLRMDHHCPWVGNCIGFRNHKFFILLCFYGTTSCLVFGASAYPLVRGILSARPIPGEVVPVDPNDPALLLFMASTVFATSFGFALATLLVQQLALVISNKTMIEANYRGRNPYSLGARRNLEQLLGACDHTWLLPVLPARPLSDGVSFPLRMVQASVV